MTSLARPVNTSEDGPRALVVEHVRATVHHKRAYDRAWAAEFERLAQSQERQGYRIVQGGGQVTPTGAGGCGPFEVTDYRTGEVLLRGFGTDDDLDAKWEPAWLSVDLIEPEVDLPEPPTTPGLPAGLKTALAEWVEERTDEAERWLDGS